jgi:predicted esterase
MRVVGLVLIAVVFGQDAGQPLSNGSSYVVRLPNGYNAGRKWPLIVCLHGNGGNGPTFLRNFEFGEARGRFILAAPSAKTGAWEGGEIEAITETADKVMKAYSVDKQDVWLIGFSGGGGMAAHTGMFKWPKFAGFCVCGNGATSYPPNLKEMKEIYVYIRNGTADLNHLKMGQDLHSKLKEAGCTNVKYEEVRGMGHQFGPNEAKIFVRWILSIIDADAKRKRMRLKINFILPETMPQEDAIFIEAAGIVWKATLGLVQVDQFSESSRGDVKMKEGITAREIAAAVIKAKLGLSLREDGTLDTDALLRRLKTKKPRKEAGDPPRTKVRFKRRRRK